MRRVFYRNKKHISCNFHFKLSTLRVYLPRPLMTEQIMTSRNLRLEVEKSPVHSTSSPGILICGPQGCGKTSHAKMLAQFYGKELILDNWTGTTPVPSNAIALTSIEGLDNAIDFDYAIKAANRFLTQPAV